ncbi:MAG: 4-(cytidine 5'-diphospho)-2-C-methyl-D-erythritol kinase [Clostridiales bacterium]|nr:4-(cytidine 5'-diphospho)-2-C-methyl-D-erythritol kinase [Clostridiales bacterium]
MSCVEKAYAKINLTLAVGEKRLDGYHEVVSVMQRVSLHDTLTAEQTREGITLTCSDPALPSGEENLAHRAASLFFRETGIAGGAALTLEKRIPSQAGLGGGSSDAASALLALRKLYAPALPDTELETMAAALGSDVPFFIRGGTQLATGRGEVLSPLPPLTDGWFVIVKPTESFSTPAMYRRLDELPPQSPQSDGMTAALGAGELRAVAAALCNSFERVVPPDSAVWVIREALRAQGALAAMLSGSGSAVFGLFDTETAARAAVEALRPAWPEIFLARPV